MSSKKVWEPFRTVYCPEIKKGVSGKVQVSIHENTARIKDKREPVRIECSGAGECGVEPTDCPIFKTFRI